MIQDSRFKIQDSRFKNQESRIKNQESRIKNQESYFFIIKHNSVSYFIRYNLILIDRIIQ